MFVKPRSGWRNATETAKLTASDGAAGDVLGGGASSGSTASNLGRHDRAGACNALTRRRVWAVYVFLEPSGGWRSETQAAEADRLRRQPLWDWLVGGDRWRHVVGRAPYATINGNADQGAAYVFLEPWGGWRSETQAAKLTASDGAEEIPSAGRWRSGPTRSWPAHRCHGRRQRRAGRSLRVRDPMGLAHRDRGRGADRIRRRRGRRAGPKHRRLRRHHRGRRA